MSKRTTWLPSVLVRSAVRPSGSSVSVSPAAATITVSACTVGELAEVMASSPTTLAAPRAPVWRPASARRASALDCTWLAASTRLAEAEPARATTSLLIMAVISAAICASIVMSPDTSSVLCDTVAATFSGCAVPTSPTMVSAVCDSRSSAFQPTVL